MMNMRETGTMHKATNVICQLMENIITNIPTRVVADVMICVMLWLRLWLIASTSLVMWESTSPLFVLS